ncbi:phosphomevalonate kinase [Streptacidiphilus sp. MAP12-20]|uniref:phosphomevalonate kinase n=1 Tax=Streptacidiphilus sp. MAP12-20 TaxID=3156299 RepID=UPI0035153DA5
MITRQRTVVRSAPGKLFVAGEYAVVEPGSPAILVAVDRRVAVTVSASDGPAVLISSDIGPQQLPWRWHDGRLGACGADEGRRAHGGLAHVVSAIEVVGRLLAERGLPMSSLEVSVSSGLHDRGTKYGLGSSGAVTVATVGAVAAFCGLELTLDARYRLAMLASAEIDARASGGDIAASTWGGWISYQAPDRTAALDLAAHLGIEAALRAPWPGFAVRRLPPPKSLSLEVGWTGMPASSTSLVSDLHRRIWRGGPSHRSFVAATTDCVRAAIDALEQGDDHALLHQIRRARGELARLDDEVRLGIFTPALTTLCEVAESVGGAAKPSGAGGGDCGIALLYAEALPEISHVRERWAEAGVLPLPIRPAAEGTEE